ncbi:TPA: glycosyltransferase, partial [Proteus mirabilis]|nr:glycosyltransferase [Proteus mirabilis]
MFESIIKNSLKYLSYYLIPDKLYRKILFKKSTGKNLNLKNPKSFNEKINARILYDENPMYTKLADKYLVRDYVKEKIGDSYLINLLGHYSSPSEINYDILPNKFVLKCNHDAGSVIIIKDK